MASKSSASLALFFSLNLLFFALVTACGSGTCPGPRSRPANPNPNGRNPNNPNPNNPNPNNPNPNNPNPNNPSPSTPSQASCPRDALKLGVCADLLGGLLNVTLGAPPVTPCCTLIQGLADLEAAICLCTVIRANILGIRLNIPLYLSLLLNVCSMTAPRGFQCA